MGETGASEILLVDAKNIFTDYHTITDAQITAVAAARTDNRAIQNSSALFKCLESSIVGDLKFTIFSQSDNILTDKNEISLFKITSECRIRNRSDHHGSDVTANLAPVSTIDDNAVTDISSTTSDTPPQNAPSSDSTALLASALNIVGDNDVVKDLIADAINAASM